MHYHGTPITPRSELLKLAGRCFCVSFAEPRDVDICHEIGQSVMLDNGAFTAWRQSRPITDWAPYYEWCSRWLECWATWAVIPDVIDGDEAANDELVDQWPHGDRGAPVWHLHESLERLDQLIAAWPLVCFGSSGAYATLGTEAWQRRMAQAMDVVCDERGVPRTRLHMLRGLRYSRGPYPFYSADSSSIGRNHAGSHKALPQDVRRMADRVDAHQPPLRWRRPAGHAQLSLEAA